MTQEAFKMPTTLAELESFGPDVCLQIPASFEEYLEWVEKCEFNIAYFNNEIIIMGNASFYHEKLVANLIFCLQIICRRLKDHHVLGSNIKIHVPDPLSPENFNADVSVVTGEPEYLTLPSGRVSQSTILNPTLVVEVTSKSTIAHDFGDKLLAYKKIPTLTQAIFVNQYAPFVTVYERKGPHHWDLRDYTQPDEIFTILGESLKVSDIYA